MIYREPDNQVKRKIHLTCTGERVSGNFRGEDNVLGGSVRGGGGGGDVAVRYQCQNSSAGRTLDKRFRGPVRIPVRSVVIHVSSISLHLYEAVNIRCLSPIRSSKNTLWAGLTLKK